jgi:hypothetical protein
MLKWVRFVKVVCLPLVGCAVKNLLTSKNVTLDCCWRFHRCSLGNWAAVALTLELDWSWWWRSLDSSEVETGMNSHPDSYTRRHKCHVNRAWPGRAPPVKICVDSSPQLPLLLLLFPLPLPTFSVFVSRRGSSEEFHLMWKVVMLTSDDA